MALSRFPTYALSASYLRSLGFLPTLSLSHYLVRIADPLSWISDTNCDGEEAGVCIGLEEGRSIGRHGYFKEWVGGGGIDFTIELCFVTLQKNIRQLPVNNVQ